MVSLDRVNTVDLVTVAGEGSTASCIKYNDLLYSVIGNQISGIPDAGTNYLFVTEPVSFNTESNTLDNYYASPDGAWFPDPLPTGLDTWGFINLQSVVIITSNDDGTFKLVCPDCYAQAQDSDNIEPAQDISFPAEIYMDENLNVDFSLSTFYTDGTVLDVTKKDTDSIGDVNYEINYNIYEEQVAAT